jgi:hypothetical protein
MPSTVPAAPCRKPQVQTRFGNQFVVPIRPSSSHPFLDLVDQTACDPILPRGTIMPKSLESPPEQGMFNNNVDLAMRVYEPLHA